MFTSYPEVIVTFCTVSHHFYNLKNLENTHGGVLLSAFSLYKWYQIAHDITIKLWKRKLMRLFLVEFRANVYWKYFTGIHRDFSLQSYVSLKQHSAMILLHNFPCRFKGFEYLCGSFPKLILVLVWRSAINENERILKKCLKFNFSFIMIARSSHQRCSEKKRVLKNFANFKGKHLCWSLILIKLPFF